MCVYTYTYVDMCTYYVYKYILYTYCRMERRAIKDSQSAKAKRFPSVGVHSYGCRPIHLGQMPTAAQGS